MFGWIKLHRSLDKWGWKTDPNVMALWVHLLLNANYETSYYLGHEIPAGSLPTGLPTLSQKTGLSISQARTSLNKLKMTGEIAVKVTPKFSIISITKWDDYQADDRQVDSQIAGKSQATSQPNRNTIRNKEIRNKEDINNIIPPDVLFSVWEDFSKLRKQKKAPLTQTALNGIRSEADKANITLQQALEICCQRGWTGFKADWLMDKNKHIQKNSTRSQVEEILKNGW